MEDGKEFTILIIWNEGIMIFLCFNKSNLNSFLYPLWWNVLTLQKRTHIQDVLSSVGWVNSVYMLRHE